MHGLHLTADLYDCRCEPTLLTDAARLAAACRALVRDAGLAAVDERWHRFPDAGPGDARSAGIGAAGATGGAAADAARGGVTGVVLLAESHFAVHTWPERRGVTLDVYVCNLSQDNSGRAEQLMAAAITRFDPARLSTHRLQRGDLAAASAPAPDRPAIPPPALAGVPDQAPAPVPHASTSAAAAAPARRTRS